MTLDEIKVVGIAGAGTMGASMAQIFAQYGYTVIMHLKQVLKEVNIL